VRVSTELGDVLKNGCKCILSNSSYFILFVLRNSKNEVGPENSLYF
jgi:hypothetical protein